MESVFEINGFEELNKRLEQLEAYAYKDVIGKACKKGAEIHLNEAKTLVPERTGATKRAMRVRAGRSKSGFTYYSAVGKRWFQGDEFYGAFQEFGWKHGGRLGRKNPKKKVIPGEHYMEYAFQSIKNQALKTMLDEIRNGLIRELGN